MRWTLVQVLLIQGLAVQLATGSQEEPRISSVALKPRNSFRPPNFKRSIATVGPTAMETAMVHEKEFVSPQVRIQMDCLTDSSLLKLNFSRPFKGVVTLGGQGQVNTKCRIEGTGSRNYVIKLAHSEQQCNSVWDGTQKTLSNTLIVRFHPSLETSNDIVKDIRCRLMVDDVLVGRKPRKLSKKAGPKPVASR